MTTAIIILVFAFVGVVAFYLGVGAWMHARFTHGNRHQAEHVKRFNGDEDN